MILTLLFTGLLVLPQPPLTGFIVDQADLLTAGFEEELNTELAEFEAQSTVEIAILTVKSLEDEALEPFALEVFRNWGVGAQGRDTGLLILISEEDRLVRLEVGYGLEGSIPDAKANDIIREIMSPTFQTGDFEGGVQGAVDEIEATVETYGIATLLEETAPYYDDTPSFFSRHLLEELLGMVLLNFLIFLVLGFFHIYLYEKKAKVLRRLPIPHALNVLIAWMAGVGIISALFGLALGHFLFILFRRLKLHNEPGSKGRRGGGRGGSSRFGGSSSGGRSGGSGGFGGGSSGGGGAGGRW